MGQPGRPFRNRVPLGSRGKTITVATQYAGQQAGGLPVLALEHAAARRASRERGRGIAMIVGVPVIVEDCAKEPDLLPRAAVGLLGTYVIGGCGLALTTARSGRPQTPSSRSFRLPRTC
jgi:hypothetical protein